MSRFPGLVWTGEAGLVYEVYMTGTPPQRMRWKLETPDPEMGITVKIKFPSALSRALTISGEEVPYNKWVRSDSEDKEANPDGYGPIL